MDWLINTQENGQKPSVSEKFSGRQMAKMWRAWSQIKSFLFILHVWSRLKWLVFQMIVGSHQSQPFFGSQKADATKKTNSMRYRLEKFYGQTDRRVDGWTNSISEAASSLSFLARSIMVQPEKKPIKVETHITHRQKVHEWLESFIEDGRPRR